MKEGEFPLKKAILKTVKALFPCVALMTVGLVLVSPHSALAVGVNDGTQAIAVGLDNILTKIKIIGPSAGGVGFGVAATIHGVSHDPMVQEKAKMGMKGAVVGGAGVFLAASIVGMAASAFAG